jgi:hypothetical protein
MKRNARNLIAYSIGATDGEIGKVKNVILVIIPGSFAIWWYKREIGFLAAGCLFHRRRY